MTGPNIEWVAITDFSPGIWSDVRQFAGGGETRAPLGAASPDNTYGCRSLASGALGPMPARTNTIDFTDFPNSGNTHRYYITGMNANLGYIIPTTGTTSAERTAVHLGLLHIHATERDYRWMRHRLYDSAASPEIELIGTAQTTSGESATSVEPRQASIFTTRMNTTTPTSPGRPVTVHVWTGKPLEVADLDRLAAVHPAEATPTTNAVADIGATQRDYFRAIGHQNRVVMLQYVNYSVGSGGAQVSTIDNWWYTDPNDNSLTNSVADFFTVENPTSIADMGSMTANELIVIKSQGGGFVVRGSIEDPTVINLPNLYSPLDGFEAVFRGVNTNAGFMYSGGHGGVYLWDGGERSVDVSANLDGAFWWKDIDSKYSDMNRWLEGQGQAAQWHDLTVLPRLWCWDNNTGGWWRLENPADIDADDDLLPIHASVSNYFGRLYLSRWTVTEAAPEYLYVYQPDVSREDYSWESQPLPPKENRHMQAREVVVVASGATQTVTVTVTNEAGTNDTASWTLNSTNPTVLRSPIKIEGRDLRVKIAVDGTGSSNVGAIVHEIRLGVYDSQHIPNE